MIHTNLLPHQEKAKHEILTSLHKTGRSACFMFKGSGKSLVALSVADSLQVKLILITSDKINIETTWPDQIDRHSEDWEYCVRPDAKKLAGLGGNSTRLVILMNYDYLHDPVRRKHLEQLPIDMWIGDESSEFKDQRTRKHKACARVVQNIRYKLMLNGEPATENLEDLFGQYRMLDGGARLGASITTFRMKYMQLDRQGYSWIPRRSSLTEVLDRVRDVTYWCHRDPSVRMPEPHYYCLKVERTQQQVDLERNLKHTFSAELKGRKIETNYAPVIFQKMLQISGGVFRYSDVDVDGEASTWAPVPTRKLDAVNKLIEDNPKAKIVIWHNYIPETELLVKHVTDSVRVINAMEGDMALRLSTFRALKGGGVLLLRCSCCRGINQLADADIAVFYSNPLSYARRAQAEGRTQRLSSKTEDTHIFDIITKGGIDEVVYRYMHDKRNLALTLPVLRNILCELNT